MNDSDTVQTTYAEAWIANRRKGIIALAPVALAGMEVLRQSADSSGGVTWRAVWLAVLGAAQFAATYAPGDARVKFAASGVMAIGGGVLAALTDGPALGTLLLILTQVLAWLIAAAVPNDAKPELVAQAPDGSFPIGSAPDGPSASLRQE